MSAVFTCSFARRTCAHASLFHDAYQRTNRTKGTKILRYCGGPVYLQVDLVHGDAEPVEDDQLCVFAHFRPQVEDGLALGALVSLDVFSPRHQQTDANPEGEWIGARLVASADRTTWMFEVNPSGRWFYQWESGATKAQRATEHLFEVYLLMMQPTLDEYKVVARTCSPNFKLVSFRRAPTDKPSETPTGVAPRLPLASALNAPNIQAFDEEEEKGAEPPVEPFFRESIDSAASTDTELAALTQTRSGIDGSASYSPLHDYEPRDESVTALQLRPAEESVLAPLSLLPSAEVVTISRQLLALVELLHTLPASVLHAVRSYTESTLLSSGYTLTPDHNIPGLGALIAPVLSTRDPPADDLPMPVYAALELALWILFDTELGRIQEHWLQQASMGLLDKVALYESYYSWLRNFQQSVNVHLEATQSGANLAGIAAAARRWLDARGVSSSMHSQECSGLEPFIAQTREVFLASSGIGNSTPDRRSTKRIRVPESAAQGVALSSSAQALRCFLGSWQADISSVEWHPVAAADVSPSAFVMLWSWRQLLVFNLSTEALTTSPTLVVSSFWNASAAKSRCSQLVLDGKPRWLRVFPSGESTSSLLLGSQRLDHYIASFRSDHNELLANFYSWPVAQDLDETSCFCLRVGLRHQSTDASTAEGLRVRVAVERGRLRRGVDVTMLGESSLTQKLQAVDQWTTLHSLQYDCRRQDAGN